MLVVFWKILQPVKGGSRIKFLGLFPNPYDHNFGHYIPLLNSVHYIHPANNLSKNRMSVIQPWCSLMSNEKLTAISAGTGIGHGEYSSSIMPQIGVEFIPEADPGPPLPVPEGSPPCITKSGTTLWNAIPSKYG
jgi:hypothetical protein